MIIEGGKSGLFTLVHRQLSNFFGVADEELGAIDQGIHEALSRSEYSFSQNPNKYYHKNGSTYFNPFHSAQYCQFLYHLSRVIFLQYGCANTLSDRIYYLNKTLNACDLYYEVALPQVFFTDHPVGSVLGRAEYGEHFSFGQNVTVGNNKGIYPRLGRFVRMLAGSTLLGSSLIGDHVVLSANSYVKDQDIPPMSLVFGSSPILTIKAIQPEKVSAYFSASCQKS